MINRKGCLSYITPLSHDGELAYEPNRACWARGPQKTTLNKSFELVLLQWIAAEASGPSKGRMGKTLNKKNKSMSI